MNYDDHNFIEITQQTKLGVAPVALVVSSESSQSSSTCRASRAVLFDKLDTAKMHGLDTSNVARQHRTCRVVSRRAKWNLSHTRHDTFDVSCRDVTTQVEFGLISIRICKNRSKLCRQNKLLVYFEHRGYHQQ